MNVPPGEWSDTYPATDDIQKICDQVKRNVEAKTGGVYDEYKAFFYRVKTTEMKQYIIKVNVGNDYLHLWVIRTVSVTPTIEVPGVQQRHKWNDLLKPFD
ncbi:hypothetical protein ILYODFUR_033677 [Ilyodon furcidens]|uniref:Cystatin domain-containing protein n=1 Tax=Ilyodon furcidens TaxID=33524 RepID=A0ABV0UBZ0_9TELE